MEIATAAKGPRVPQKRIAVLLSLTTPVIVRVDEGPDTIHHLGRIFDYCGTADGIAYYSAEPNL